MTDLNGATGYDYDKTYQLTRATHPAMPEEQFSYDPVGNQLGTAVDLDNALLEDSEYTYAYDFNGNRIERVKKETGEKTQYFYDFENRLIKVESPGLLAQYKYDPFGRRIEKNVNGAITRYAYDGPNVLLEYDGSGNIKARYLHNLAIDDPLAVEQNGQIYYYHKDGLGSIVSMTDQTGQVVQTYEYDSFGNISSRTGNIPNPFTYTGREYDEETALYYYRARYYDPKAGRFITRDPIGFAGGDVNLYRYVQNNPVTWVDPMGLAVVVPIPSRDSFSSQFPSWVPDLLVNFFYEMSIDISPVVGTGQGSNFAGKTIKEILKQKRGCIRNAPLPKGTPSWDDLLNMTWEELESMLKNTDAWRTIRKLLTDKRFDK
jgi:RHS repeat-associated protein